MDSPLPLSASQALALGIPAMCVMFALGFACIWAHERPRTYLLLYAAAFAAHAGGTLLRIFDRPAATADDLAAAVFSIGSALLLARGLLARSGAGAETSPLGALGIAVLIVLLHFHLMLGNAPAFAYTLGVGEGLLLLLAWMRLGGLRQRGPADRALYWALPLAAIYLFLGVSWMAGAAAILFMLGGLLFASALSDIIAPLKHERVTDPLTRLKNRRNFEDLSQGRLQRHPDYPFSLILLDLDQFKRINDTYGHAAGDAALVETGRVIRECIRSGDMAWRLGGDEFAILMPGTPVDAAVQAAEYLRAQLGQARLQSPLGVFGATASFGIAQSRMDEPLHDLFVRTDILLYGAKQQGRNRISYAAGNASGSRSPANSAAPEDGMLPLRAD